MAAPLTHTTFPKIDDVQSSELTRDANASGGGGKEFMLFGVRVQTEGSFRKSVSMNNLAQYEQQPQENEIIAGYVSDDVVHPSGRIRKRGIPWSEEEHRSFLLGLQKVGKGDWRGISRNFVKTRTPTQIASHAQKYFIRRNNHSRRRRRSSLFDITADPPVMESAIEDEMHQQQAKKPNKNIEEIPISAIPLSITPTAISITRKNSTQYFGIGQVNQLNNSPKPLMSIPILPSLPSSKMANLHLNNNIPSTGIPSLSLNLSILPQSTLAPNQQSPHGPNEHGSAYQVLPARFKGRGGDNMISVA